MATSANMTPAKAVTSILQMRFTEFECFWRIPVASESVPLCPFLRCLPSTESDCRNQAVSPRLRLSIADEIGVPQRC